MHSGEPDRIHREWLDVPRHVREDQRGG